MIPLSRWLSDRDEDTPLASPEFDRSAAEPVIITEEGDPSDDVCDVSRVQELEDALRVAEETLAHEMLNHAQREENLRQSLGTELAEGLSLQLRKGIEELQRNIEASISDVLKPFLVEQSQTRVISALMTLIDADLRDQSQPLIEIRAPAHLHDELKKAILERNITTSLSESRRIELAFTGQTSRFELLADRWRGLISGDDS